MFIFAHRGAARTRREQNTIGAFRAALAAGCALETDARISADGAAVLIHDRWIWRFPFVRRVRKRSAAQLARSGVPTIDEFYAALGTDFDVSIDLKVGAVGALLLAAGERHGAAERLWLVSESFEALAALRASSTSVRLVHESRSRSIGNQRDHSDRLAAAGINAQNTQVGTWQQEAVAYSHACGVLAFGSLANDADRFDRARAIGIDAMYTDRLDLARSATS